MSGEFKGRAAWVPSHAEGVALIAAVWRASSADAMREGLTWYADARRIAGRVGRAAGFRGAKATTVGAGVLAALSPAFLWADSIPAAFAVVSGDAAGLFATDSNLEKARRIVAGEAPLDVLVGSKVRAFFASIMAAGNTDAVCIDRHAMAIVAGRKLSDSEQGGINNVGVYDAVAAMYVSAAAALGVPAAMVQAVTWVTWREWTFRRRAGFVPAELGAALA